MKLIEITAAGEPAQEIAELPIFVSDVGTAYVNLYRTLGFVRPWLGYLALDNIVCIGTCGFKGPPANNRVEIAYFTFPPNEGQGYATRMARMLIELTRKTAPTITVAARTLPEENASTSILRKLGFSMLGAVIDPEDGEVWEWQLPDNVLRATCEDGCS